MKQSRLGFTLVEMLVSVGLVVLMMVLFAEVFSIATKSMSKQRGVAENDQKARMLDIVIRGDLRNRSYRQVKGEHGIRALAASDAAAAKQSAILPYCNGYLYISENNPNDQTDDVLQFTLDMQYAPPELDGSIPQIFGRALQFGWDDTPLPNGTARDALQNNPDQPCFDDQVGFYNTGALTSDHTGSSRYAEVCYFLRNGNLYRRCMLIRNPVDTTKPDSQPKRSDGTDLLPANRTYTPNPMSHVMPFIWNPNNPGNSDSSLSSGYNSTIASFWCDFDYSATWSGGIRFIGVTASENCLNNFQGNSRSLGLPQNRFCFKPIGPGVPSRSFEYTDDALFVGRFTHNETSDPRFAWPGDPGAGGDAIYYTADDTNIMTAGQTSSPNGVVLLSGAPLNGPRISQDLLATNVHEFDVKLWDDQAINPVTGFPGAFVDIGGSVAAKYSKSQNMNYGSNNPAGFGQNVYDTWTADASANGSAPFRSPDNGVDGKPGKAGIDDDGQNGIDDNGEVGWPGTDDWHDLRAIQIHIRYYDVSSNSTRDLTLIQALAD